MGIYSGVECSIDDCKKQAEKRGWCGTHYSYWRKTGDPLPSRRAYSDPAEAFAARVAPADGCLVWTGAKNARGYGKLWVTRDGIRAVMYAHRYAWEVEYGPIPEALHIDHICHNKSCVDIDHLRLATNKQNHENLRGARSDSSSGIRGAIWDSQKGKWAACVQHHGVKHHLGFYGTPEEAGLVAEAKRRELFTHL